MLLRENGSSISRRSCATSAYHSSQHALGLLQLVAPRRAWAHYQPPCAHGPSSLLGRAHRLVRSKVYSGLVRVCCQTGPLHPRHAVWRLLDSDGGALVWRAQSLKLRPGRCTWPLAVQRAQVSRSHQPVCHGRVPQCCGQRSLHGPVCWT